MASSVLATFCHHFDLQISYSFIAFYQQAALKAVQKDLMTDPGIVGTSDLKMLVKGKSIGQHLIASIECTKTYTGYNFWIIGQARLSFHSSILESVYLKTQNPVLCRQKKFVSSLGLFK